MRPGRLHKWYYYNIYYGTCERVKVMVGRAGVACSIMGSRSEWYPAEAIGASGDTDGGLSPIMAVPVRCDVHGCAAGCRMIKR